MASGIKMGAGSFDPGAGLLDRTILLQVTMNNEVPQVQPRLRHDALRNKDVTQHEKAARALAPQLLHLVHRRRFVTAKEVHRVTGTCDLATIFRDVCTQHLRPHVALETRPQTSTVRHHWAIGSKAHARSTFGAGMGA